MCIDFEPWKTLLMVCLLFQVIAMCEKKANTEAKVTKVPIGVLKVLQFVTGFFQWTRDASDRLAFANLLTNNEVNTLPSTWTLVCITSHIENCCM